MRNWLVAITRPETLWDRLGRRDTLARAENTALQRAHAEGGGAGSGACPWRRTLSGRAA